VLFFYSSTYRFYRFKFQVSTGQIATTSSLMMSGPNSLNLNPLDYQVCGQCWSLNKSCNRCQNQFPSFKCKSSAVRYDPLSHSRHNAGDRRTKVGYEINGKMSKQESQHVV